MRVFVLCTGRCGSLTFAKACSHITNYTVAHESDRLVELDYPDQHIEIDNRLAYFLGDLYYRYAVFKDQDTVFATLIRDRMEVITSYAKRYRLHGGGIMKGHQWYVLKAPVLRKAMEMRRLGVAQHFVDATLKNIGAFNLLVAATQPDIPLPLVNISGDIEKDFRHFWKDVKAEGDFDAALAEFGTKHNAEEG